MTVYLPEPEPSQSDDAARAGWLYYVGGLTQDQIARELGVSRQRVQRLVSRAMAEGLIHVRLNHPIAACLDLEAALTERFGLERCRVAPHLGRGSDPLASLAATAAVEIERVLRLSDPKVIAVGTGRTLRATVEAVTAMECPQHRLVSLNGNIAPDGAATYYDVISRLADRIQAPHYPMPLPVVIRSAEECELFRSTEPIRRVMALAREADVTFIGIGQLTDTAPMMKDGFISRDQLSRLQALGAAGEIAGWVYDGDGIYLEGRSGLHIASIQVRARGGQDVTAIAGGIAKEAALRAGLKGQLFNGLVTDEDTARSLLAAVQQ